MRTASLSDLVEALVERRTHGAPLPIPSGFQAELPESDTSAEEDNPTLEKIADLIGDLVELHYMDSKGEPSRRMVTIRSVSSQSQYFYIHCHCHYRHAPRMFRADRVTRIVRNQSTGEIIEDVVSWVQALRKMSPLESTIRDCRHSLAILLFIAQCDGDFSDDEHAIIAEYLWEMSGYDESIDIDALKHAIWPKWPDEETFRRAMNGVRYHEKARIPKMMKYLRRVVDSDKILSPEEMDLMIQLDQVLPRR